MLLLAAALIFMTGFAHSYLGERYILMRLFRQERMPALFGSTAFTMGTLRFAWHITTLVWWGFAYLLFCASQGTVSQDQVLVVIATTSLVSAALPLYFTRGKHLSWLVFLLVGILVLLSRSGT